MICAVGNELLSARSSAAFQTPYRALGSPGCQGDRHSRTTGEGWAFHADLMIVSPLTSRNGGRKSKSFGSSTRVTTRGESAQPGSPGRLCKAEQAVSAAGGEQNASSGRRAPALGHKRPLEWEDDRLYTVGVRFEWDPRKAAANLCRHKVSFAEAVTVLEDEFGLTREDSDVVEEERFATLGLSSFGSLLVVVYTYRGPGMIRVISAWKANRRQKGVYEKSRS